MVDIYLTQRFIIAWRIWLTANLTDDWLEGRAYYRDLFIDNTIDNPDQRIQQDIDIFTANAGGTPNIPSNGTGSTLLFGAVNAVASVISFAAILWNLSGNLNLFGVEFPRAMFWTVLVYVLVATVVAIWLGHPLIRLSFNNEKLNAAFRYALVRLRDAAEAVGFYRGERVERAQLWRRFTPIIDNYRKFVRRTIIFNGWNWSVSQAIVPLPWVIQAPRLFAGQIDFGDVGQSATAFGNIQDSLSFFRNNYDAFAAFRAAIIRLHGLVDANAQGRALPTMLVKPSEEATVELRDVEVRTPAGDRLIDPLDVQLDDGDSLVITGRSGAGKTTLLRSLAELWPYASGTLCRPDGDNATMFLSQLPYVPLGNLRTVVCYPNSPDDISDDELRDVLTKVALAPLIGRLDEEQDWAKVLSPGEQQRVAFARILLTKPKAVFLDEATSALDEGLEFALYQLLRTELPDCVVVSVSHRPTVEQHHEQELRAARRRPMAAGPGGGGEGARAGLAGSGPALRVCLARACGSRPSGRVRSGAAAEERALPQLRAAGVALAVLGDVGRARPGRVQPGHDGAVLALHLAVDGDVASPPMVNPAYIALPSDMSNAPHGPFVLRRKEFRLLVEVGVLAAWRRSSL